MTFAKTNTDHISTMRQQLYQTFTAALDSMWESLYIANAQAYLIQQDDNTMGYCCIDAEGSLLQFFLYKEHRHLTKQVISSLIDQKLISNAKLSAIEPVSFNACLALSNAVEEDTFCYEFSDHSDARDNGISLEPAQADDLETVRSFYKTQVGFDDNFGYTQNLIDRQELFLAKKDDVFIGTGECRLSDTQPKVADIGVAVHQDFRKKGHATRILQLLALKAQAAGRAPICSTTLDNIGSQKAIGNAGFYCAQVIFGMRF